MGLKAFLIGDQQLTISNISEIIDKGISISLSLTAKKKIQDCRIYLDKKTESLSDPIYGVNTGFGSLCNHKISLKDLGKLQRNLVFSHACGTGDPVPFKIVKIMMLLKIQSLSYGHSGVH